jgi:hypothetical protein
VGDPQNLAALASDKALASLPCRIVLLFGDQLTPLFPASALPLSTAQPSRRLPEADRSSGLNPLLPNSPAPLCCPTTLPKMLLLARVSGRRAGQLPHGGITLVVASRKIDDESPHRGIFEVKSPCYPELSLTRGAESVETVNLDLSTPAVPRCRKVLSCSCNETRRSTRTKGGVALRAFSGSPSLRLCAV